MERLLLCLLQISIWPPATNQGSSTPLKNRVCRSSKTWQDGWYEETRAELFSFCWETTSTVRQKDWDNEILLPQDYKEREGGWTCFTRFTRYGLVKIPVCIPVLSGVLIDLMTDCYIKNYYQAHYNIIVIKNCYLTDQVDDRDSCQPVCNVISVMTWCTYVYFLLICSPFLSVTLYSKTIFLEHFLAQQQIPPQKKSEFSNFLNSLGQRVYEDVSRKIQLFLAKFKMMPQSSNVENWSEEVQDFYQSVTDHFNTDPLYRGLLCPSK